MRPDRSSRQQHKQPRINAEGTLASWPRSHGEGAVWISDEKQSSWRVKTKNRNSFNFYGNSDVYAIWMILLTLKLIIDVCRKHYVFPNSSTIGDPKTLRLLPGHFIPHLGEILSRNSVCMSEHVGDSV